MFKDGGLVISVNLVVILLYCSSDASAVYVILALILIELCYKRVYIIHDEVVKLS